MATKKEKMPAGAQKPKAPGFMAWLYCLAGWLICAGLCLWFTVEMEAYPAAYDMFFPAVLLILFCNILLFLFVAVRWAQSLGKLGCAIARICLGEGLFLAGMYLLGRFFIN